jgi:hypothetical protein
MRSLNQPQASAYSRLACFLHKENTKDNRLGFSIGLQKEYAGMTWIDQVQDGKKGWAAVNKVIKLRYLKMGEFG